MGIVMISAKVKHLGMLLRITTQGAGAITAVKKEKRAVQVGERNARVLFLCAIGDGNDALRSFPVSLLEDCLIL